MRINPKSVLIAAVFLIGFKAFANPCSSLLTAQAQSGNTFQTKDQNVSHIFGKKWLRSVFSSLSSQTDDQIKAQFYNTIDGYEKAQNGNASPSKKERIANSALVSGEAYLKVLGVKTTEVITFGRRTLRIEPNETALGKIAQTSMSEFGVNIYFDPIFMVNGGLAAYDSSNKNNLIMLSPVAMLPEFSHILIHELIHAETNAHLRQNIPSEFYGKVRAEVGVLPFALEGYETYLTFDEIKSYWMDKNHLIVRYRDNLRSGNIKGLAMDRILLTNGIRDSRQVIGQVIGTVESLLKEIWKNSSSVTFFDDNGHRTAKIVVSENGERYIGEIPLIPNSEQSALSEKQFLIEYLTNTIFRGMEVLVKLDAYEAELNQKH